MSDLRPPLVIGLGNPYRTDDGIGSVVLHELRRMGVANVDLVEVAGQELSLPDLWEQRGLVIAVDAAVCGENSVPGTIHRFDALGEKLPADIFRCSTHSMGLPEAVELGRVLGKLPGRLVVYGIECREFGFGEMLSPGLDQAAVRVARMIAEDVRRSEPVHRHEWTG